MSSHLFMWLLTMRFCHQDLGLKIRKVKGRNSTCFVAKTVKLSRKATSLSPCEINEMDGNVRNSPWDWYKGPQKATRSIERAPRLKQRVSKIIALREFCSRREAELLISRSEVIVDGVRTQQGTKADFDSEIQIGKIGGLIWLQSKSTVALNKPRGYVSNLPLHGEVEAFSLLDVSGLHFPSMKKQSKTENDARQLSVCGRLDKNSRGLIVLTQDGILARVIVASDFVLKTYLVEVESVVTKCDLERLNGPCNFLTDVIRPIRVRLLAPSLLEFVLREGKNRQIRRICDQMGLNVVDLMRVRLGKSELGSLPEGSWRTVSKLEGDALKEPRSFRHRVSRL
jgi:23S rRNA pseudouridine2604 synthase